MAGLVQPPTLARPADTRRLGVPLTPDVVQALLFLETLVDRASRPPGGLRIVEVTLDTFEANVRPLLEVAAEWRQRQALGDG